MNKGHRFLDIVIQEATYFKLRFTLSYRNMEELMAIRGGKVDYSTFY